MAYKKPEVVAKSESKQSFVAGCPTNQVWSCGGITTCQIVRMN
jgi:hypothetical protein